MPGPRPIYQQRRPPQNPTDGKGEHRHSSTVKRATDAMKKSPDSTNPVSIIANYSRLGEGLRAAGNFRKVAMEIARIAELAETTVTEETSDWFDGHTVKRNMAELKKYSGAFTKLAEELDMMQQRASALYDDMGNVLTRYFEMADLEPISSGINPDADTDKGPEGFSPEDRAPEFDGPGGNPADDAGRKESHNTFKPDAHDDGDMLPDSATDMYDSEDDDDVLEGIVNRIMEKLVPESDLYDAPHLSKYGSQHDVPKGQTADPNPPKKSVKEAKKPDSAKLKRMLAKAKQKGISEKEFWDYMDPKEWEDMGFPDGMGEGTSNQDAQKSLKTPKAFARPHTGFTHDQAKEILKRTGATAENAQQIMDAANDKKDAAKAVAGSGSRPSTLQKKEEALRRIVSQHQHARIQGVTVDATTANLLVKVLDALNPANKQKFLGLPITKMADFAWSVVKKK